MSEDVPHDIGVVVCTKNEASRIAACLEGLLKNLPHDVVVVDAASTDGTREVAASYGVKVLQSTARTLADDRQMGIDAVSGDLVAMVDADHYLGANDLASLKQDLFDLDLDIVQAQLAAWDASGFWQRAEAASWRVTHNHPGARTMIGTAPCLYRREVFESVRFNGTVTALIDDTDFMYRLAQCSTFRIGVGHTVIPQHHFGGGRDYLRKFLWYGRGDGQFMRKHPRRAASMMLHLAFRYPVMYSIRAGRRGEWNAVPFFVVQGLTRSIGALLEVMRSWRRR